MYNFPTGTVTFLFTDIEGSTQLWEKYPEAMRTALALHDSILREAIESNHGRIIKTTGDGTHAVFERAVDAVGATLIAQRNLGNPALQFPSSRLGIKVRMGLHTGEAELRDGDYYGQVLNRAARLMSAAHGGQILVSKITAEVIREHLPGDVMLQDLGEHHLKDLARPEHIYQLTASYLAQNFPRIRTLTEFQNNLPTQLTSFVGREKERAEIKKLLESARLVTLTGSGGTGKTRLAIEVGAEDLDHFPHGVWLVELAPLTDGSQIIPALGQVLSLQENPFASLDTLLMDYVRDKKMLLIFDNCEHLIADCARIADHLLRHAAGLKILASSREALGIAGEAAFHVPSLADTEALNLFVERATAINPRFSLSDTNAAHVAQICSRLEGIPLAIELAAARTRLLSPEQIAARLDDRFRLLIGGSRTALPRQQTLRALIDWSYDLLADAEKSLFRIASVFLGGWTVEALEAVADDSGALEHLEQLINKSLVVAEERGGQMRYSMLETIRQYAREKLFDAKEASAARDRHFAYYEQLSEQMWEAFRSTSDQLAWRDTIDDEFENLRSALAWGWENNLEDTIHLAANFCVVSGWVSSIREGLPLVESVITRFKSLPPLDGDAEVQRQRMLARALFAWGMVNMGTPVAARTLEEAIAIARRTGDRLLLGYGLEMYYTAARFHDLPNAIEAAEEGLRIFTEEIDDNWGLAMAYQSMVSLALQRGDLDEREKYFRRLKEVLGEAPTSFQAGIFFLGIGLDESYRGNAETAKQILDNGLQIFKRLRNRGFETIFSSELGHLARRAGDIQGARKIYCETIRIWQELGNRAAIAHQLECFGLLALFDEEPQRALRLFGAAEALREKIETPMTPEERIEYEHAKSQVHSLLSENEFNSLLAEGRLMQMNEAIEFALGA